MIETCQIIRDNWKHGGDIDQIDMTVLEDIFENHPDWDKKKGVGIRRMWVQKNEPYSTYGFWIERIDGTKTDISYMEAIRSSGKSKTNGFKSALRLVIDNQIHDFRAVNNMDETRHADHDPSFESLVKRFVKENGVCDVSSADGQIGVALADESYSAKWQAFHKKEAKLFNISREENLRKKKK